MRNMKNYRTEIAVAIAMMVFTACTMDASDVTNDGDGLGIKLSAETARNPYEWDTAVAGTPPEEGFHGDCVTMPGAKACFERHGDRWWVLDTVGDGHSATASWKNWLLDGSSSVLWRNGSCVNKLGKDHWGVCNKEYWEDRSLNVLGSTGSSLEWQACVYDSQDGTWHGCSDVLEVLNNQ
jgi:hypothetical protein